MQRKNSLARKGFLVPALGSCMNLTIYFKGFLLFYWCSLFYSHEGSLMSIMDIDLESAIYRPLRRVYEYDSEEENIIIVQEPYEGTIDDTLLLQYDTVPFAQHFASFPIWFVIFYLGNFINSESIILQAINFVAMYIFVLCFQWFVGYNLILNFRSFPYLIEFERINYPTELSSVKMNLSQWVMVPFAWATEIALILSNESKSLIRHFISIPSEPILLIIFVIQLIYIYACRSAMR